MLLKKSQAYRKSKKQDSNRHIVPVAIVMAQTDLSAKKADELLTANKGLVRRALSVYKKNNKKIPNTTIIGKQRQPIK